VELEEFLADLRKLLEEVVNDGEGLVPPYLLPLLREAWPEVAGRYDGLQEAVYSGEFERQLVDRGLRGPQFQVKVEGFRRHLAVFGRIRRPKWLKNALKWADIILGSLASIIPGGDAVQEFKESVEAGAEDMDDDSATETENE
jgi:hypothetical protein